MGSPRSRLLPRTLLLPAALGALFLVACASAVRRAAVPANREADAVVTGFPAGIRYFPRDAGHVKEFERDYLSSLERERAYRRAAGFTDELAPSTFLAISGGGDQGAFGAGLLNGWTKFGTRPTFKLVTGVSTGALIAPFAFLGPGYDEELKSLYTGISLENVATKRSFLAVLYNDAMADNAPLRDLVRKYVTPRALELIAAEHFKGRILLVATTNLDARRSVIWNLTEIAASGLPGALDLVRKVMIASAAIPGTFPPAMIDVEVDGKPYHEMHVDGATATQVFVYPAAIRLQELAPRERTLYIVRNARLDPQWAQVDRRTLPIAFRAITCLTQYQGIGDLYRIYSITQRDHVDFNLAYIPPTFKTPHTKDFDTGFMRELFDVGYKMAAAGYPWEKRPPVLISGVDDAVGSR